MARYSCRFLNQQGRIEDVEIIECETDSLAEARATVLFSRRDFPRLELWQQDRFVSRQETAPTHAG